jgi:hypothetical protein
LYSFLAVWGGSEARNENGGGAEFVSIGLTPKCCFRGASDRVFAEDAKGCETLQGGAKAHLTIEIIRARKLVRKANMSPNADGSAP